ncbi:sensor histidine kinase [Rugosimonospora africana]|uniref:histidine kinase n=1 Tax=Rugosimonospora africana TaxID=556532 RepID=A0A8J3R009_9ACTN|nr:sensor histidine kinase [Rugosimonospora africana]GIH19726.1 histidine kinase [Rugosimonospora africana]
MARAARSARYLLAGGLSATVAALVLAGLVGSAVLSLVGIGVPVLAWVLRMVRSLADGQRRSAGRLLGAAIPQGAPPDSGSVVVRLRAALRDPATPRELAWLVLHAAVGLPAALCVPALCVLAVGGLSTPLFWWVAAPEAPMTFFIPITSWSRALAVPALTGFASLVALRYGIPILGSALATAYRVLLAPSAHGQLSRRVEELSATRAGALDAHAAELRRIERDLHDGVQARLVAIAIQLGVAQGQRSAAPQLADQLIERARSGVEDALEEMRHVVRGVYPPILADRGLSGAVDALAVACPVPVETRIDPMGRLLPAVESAAYFVIAEALTNIAKHSGATTASLCLEHDGARLLVRVDDNGAGGADESRGTGLSGIRRRVAALDGCVGLDSPRGGPTRLRVELPCAS